MNYSPPSNPHLKDKFNIITIVKSCEIDFIKLAKLDDNFEISTSLINKSKIQIFLKQNIYYKNSIVVKATVRIVILDIKGKVSKMILHLFNIFLIKIYFFSGRY